MAEPIKTNQPVKLNTDYNKTVGIECTIMRLSATGKTFRNPLTGNTSVSYPYALIEGELPKDAKVYGKDGRVIFYTNKLVGAHMQKHKANLAVVQSTDLQNVVTNRVVILRTDAEIRQAEKQQNEVRELLKEASQYGLTKQEVGKMKFQAMFASKFGASIPQETSESEG